MQAQTTPEGVYSLKYENIVKYILIVALIVGVTVTMIDLITHISAFSISDIRHYYTISWVNVASIVLTLSAALLLYFVRKLTHSFAIAATQKEAQVSHQQKLLETYIHSLGAGNFNAQLSDEFENQKVKTLLDSFKLELIKDKEEEKIRSWENSGLTQFAEILRSTHDLNILSDQVVLFLVKYLSCNQGSIFILDNSDPRNLQLEMTACYAFERKKHLTQKIEIGQGLVSQCYLEKETLVLLQVPKDYIKITSGLGTGTPGFLILVPIKNNEHISGVIELAAFKKLEPYKIAFLEKAAAAFGSVIQNVKTNANVKTLLQDSQHQTEMLRAQEEEMRQNMEELQTMQEQITRQLHENVDIKKELEAREKVLGLTTILSESDLFGTITFVNKKFCQVSQYSEDELLGEAHNIVRHPDMPREIFALMWSTIKRGHTFRGIVKNRKKDGTHYWVDATIVPITQDNRIIKYIGARYHIKDEELAQKLYATQLAELGLTHVDLAETQLTP